MSGLAQTDDVRRRRPLGRAADWLVARPWVVVLVALLVAAIYFAILSRSTDHQVQAVFTSAASLYKGLDVRVDGLDAGKVQDIQFEEDHAVVTLGIDDEVWPLHEGATATLRFGTTIGNGTRIIELDPGPESGRELAEDAVLPNEDTIEATEFDDVFDIFDADTRRSVQSLAVGMGETFGPRARELGAGIEETEPGLDAIGGVASELARDTVSLRALVVNSERVMRAIAARRAQLEDLLTVAAATFDEFASNTEGITASLERFPSALRETRTTLARVDESVHHLDALVTDLAPGAAELAPLARRLRPALAELRDTVPTAVSTLRAGTAAAPSITELLDQLGPFSDLAAPSLTRLAPMVGCIRPYAPEIAALLSTWGSFTKNYDNDAHYGRLWANYGPTSVTSTPEIDTQTFTQLTGQGYALVRPPGYNAGESWFLPECNAGPEGIDPAQDPEDPE